MKGSIRRRSKGSWELTIGLGRDEQGKQTYLPNFRIQHAKKGTGIL